MYMHMYIVYACARVYVYVYVVVIMISIMKLYSLLYVCVKECSIASESKPYRVSRKTAQS